MLSQYSRSRFFSHFMLALAFLATMGSVAFAQQAPASSDVPSANAAIAVAVTGAGLRFTASSSVEQLRLEVFDLNGASVLDTGFLSGNLRDWGLTDGQGQRLADGPYRCVVTVKGSSGQVSSRQRQILVQDGQASLVLSENEQSNPLESENLLTPKLADEQRATTVVAHDGSEGELIRSRGPLSFRLGDFYSGEDSEQMRLTEDGNLGIGTENPQAKLDVNGVIRAQQGIQFADGSLLNVSPTGRLKVTLPSGKTAAANITNSGTNLTGTGTQNQVAKWTDSAGTLGDSALTEVGGNVGIGTNSPAALLHIQGSTETVRQSLSNTSSYIQFAFFEGGVKKGAFGYQGSTSSGFVGGPSAMVFGTLTSSPVAFFTNGTERVRLAVNGNFGIGTVAPQTPLDVAGAINSSTQYNISNQRVLSAGGLGNLFAGFNAGQANTGSSNSFFGGGAGAANTSGFSNSFFGFQSGLNNMGGGNNSFFGNGVGAANTSGSANSFFGDSAGHSNQTGSNNNFFGFHAGFNNSGSGNNFFGYQAGAASTTGAQNSFFGDNAGQQNISSANSFFGYQAGMANTSGDNNSFFGNQAGLSNAGGLGNSFFGSNAGRSNTSGGVNTFLGSAAGYNNQLGNFNTFVGDDAGDHNTGDSSGNASGNTFVGRSAGTNNTLGSNNSFFGNGAGFGNITGNNNTIIGASAGSGRFSSTTGSNNTIIGAGADISSSDQLSFATAIGAGAVVRVSNAVELGRQADTVFIPGDLFVAGSVMKSGGSFKIDDPLDPQNKTLSHSFVESPDMMNIYNGNVTTDTKGTATITLPPYFEALNRDFRYQLTVIGQFAQAIVSQEIEGNRFSIKTDKPNVKVSWQVTGIRHDRFAEDRRIPIEEDKSANERGKCLYEPACRKRADQMN